jgi:hypothetical protein
MRREKEGSKRTYHTVVIINIVITPRKLSFFFLPFSNVVKLREKEEGKKDGRELCA